MKRLRNMLLATAAFIGLATALSAQPYAPPASNRADINLDAGWRFIRQDATGAQNTSFDDSAWTSLNLPHTWNNLDGQDGGNNYYRGIGWYRTHYVVNGNLAGRHFFLKFDGAFQVTDVYLNGNLLGEHKGGFAAFVFDVTPYLTVGSDNVIAVKVNNAFNADIPPLTADFTFFGGIYRDVHLLVTDPVQISPLDCGSPGIYLKPTNVSSNSATLQITAVVSNSTALAQTVTVRAVVTDAATNIVTLLTNVVTLPAATVSNVVMSTVITNPHLWNGLADPYLYQTFVELRSGTAVTDVVAQPLGFRWFSVDATNGFFLNGRHYDLHGVDMHQDWYNCGWALTNAQRATNFVVLKELGATAVRLSHYEHDDYTYQLADQAGIILWSEVPLINYITVSPGFYTNTLQQLQEMIRQRYNHPSVVCWSVYNEITLTAGPSPTNLIALETQLVNVEDSTRPTTAAANTSDNDPSTLYTQWIDFNKYYGWYNGVVTDFGPWADSIHATYPTRLIGVSEYGAGASIYQHSENPVAEPASGGGYHPEEYQNIFHESHWLQMKARPFLWSKFIWNLFDFASDARSEGDAAGRNDKGLVTYDRQVRKDAFYWYKANWSDNPMVYITGHTFTNRSVNATIAKVYANCDSVELFINGVSQGQIVSTNCIYNWPVTLYGGTNIVQAVGTRGGSNVTDSLIWVAPVSPPAVVIVSPSTPTIFLNSSNMVLPVSATVTDFEPNAAPPVTNAWIQTSGPVAAIFDDTNALATNVHFPTNGVYNLAFQAAKGALVTRAGLVVVVGAVPYGPSIKVRYAFDDAGPGTTTSSDTSGGGVNVPLKMFNNLGAAADYHGADNSGVAGPTTGNRALDFSANFGQGVSGGIAATTNASLGFGTVTSFVTTMWFKLAVPLTNNIGPRMFVLGNSTNTDCGTANSIGMKFQDASDLWFFINTSQATASFSTSLSTSAWIFVAMTYDGTNALLYEGTDQASAALVSTTAFANLKVPLGANASLDIGNRLDRTRDFDGWIDDFRFYTGAGDVSFVESIRQSAAGPGGVTGVSGNNHVSLSWNALLGATSYNIKRATISGGPYTIISTAGTVTGTNYVDVTATNGMTYYYVVSAATAISVAGETANSAIEAGVALPLPPATPVASYNSPMYAGMTLNLTASTILGATYGWTGPNGFVSASQNPSLVNAGQSASGTYSVTATVGGLSSTPGIVAVTVNPPLTFSIRAAAGSLIFNWPFGTLQSATNVVGPWSNVGGATAPYTNLPVGPQQFYRIQLQ